MKDYFHYVVFEENKERLRKRLSVVPQHLIFTSYKKAAEYRVANVVKRENGRYDDSIVCFDKYYYLVPAEAFKEFKSLVQFLQKDEKCENAYIALKSHYEK